MEHLIGFVNPDLVDFIQIVRVSEEYVPWHILMTKLRKKAFFNLTRTALPEEMGSVVKLLKKLGIFIETKPTDDQ